ncbi:ABC transporter ATP-binding protein [Coprothermobacteraceae bacterium]|nr:ABC transporter ATP-binding protein [Coprothermobacteraceae bacterium]
MARTMLEGDTPVIETSELTKIYGKGYQPALDSVVLRVKRGEFVYLVGPTGAGKTTLLHILMGLRRPTYGWARVLGHQLTPEGVDDLLGLRRKLGVIFQGSYLLNDKTVYENVVMSLEVRDYPIGAAKEAAENLLYRLGLLDKKNYVPSELSGGQKQLVAFARAIIHKPELLIADEPTANLDMNTARDVVRLMQKLASDLGITVLLATHNVELVAEMGARVIRLDKGRVVFDASKIPTVIK